MSSIAHRSNAEYLLQQQQRLDKEFQLAFAKHSINYEFVTTVNGELVITLPSTSAFQYRSIKLLDEDGNVYTQWTPFKIGPKNLARREITGKPIRV